MAKQSTELANVAKGGELAELDELQSLFRENAGSGLDNIRPEDIILPRLTILQPTSPLAQEDGYSAGDIVNSITNENYGRKFEFYVLHYYPNRVRWESPDPGSPIDCRSEDGLTGTKRDAEHAGGNCGACPYAQWRGDERPSCTAFKNLIVLPKTEDASPIVYSAKRSALKPTNQLLSALAVERKPAYASTWVLAVEKNQKDRQTWYTPKFTKGETIKTVAEFHALKQASDSMVASQSRIRFSQDDRAEEGGTSSGTEEAF